MQQGKHHPNSMSRNEFFNPHQEPVSGHLVFPHKQSEEHTERVNYFSGPLYHRPLHSGPLLPGYGLEMARKEVGEQPSISNKMSLPKLSGLVAFRTSSHEDKKENPIPFKHQETILVQKSLQSSNVSESRRRRDRTDLRQIENEKVSTETSLREVHGSIGKNIHLSGPLVVSSNNMDHMLKERDRKIQEYSRRSRIFKLGDKARAKQK